MQRSDLLDPFTLPLRGSRLIEASAGTGKTWTIAALYLRLVLGHGESAVAPLSPEQILVVTFTRAATRELGERIRARLVEAAACFRGEREPDPADSFLRQLLQSYKEADRQQQAAWLLSNAAENMDVAAIFTIDAWCQRMLREHAFDSGSLFDEKLVADERELFDLAVKDVWRQQIYPLTGESLDSLLEIWGSIEQFRKDARNFLAAMPPGYRTMDRSLISEWQKQKSVQLEAVQTLKSHWAPWIVHMCDWLGSVIPPASPESPFKSNMLNPEAARAWFILLQEWCADPAKIALVLPDQAWKRFCSNGLTVALKKNTSVAIPPDWSQWDAFREALRQLPRPDRPLRLVAAALVHQRLQGLKSAARTFGFQDMLERLAQALAGSNGSRLRKRIVQQYPVALIDEFQDTSSLQFHLFDQLYHIADNDPESAILLIGDPKQSIYAFRGADIRSYLQAREATTGRQYSLTRNYRSIPKLVEGVNQLFLAGEQRTGPGAFLHRSNGSNPIPFVANHAHGRPEILQRGDEPMPAMEIVYGTGPESRTQMLSHFSRACAEHLVCLLNDRDICFLEGSLKRPVRPADIAILVRDRNEAAAVRGELRQRGVLSVYLSDQDSVFSSAEAKDLVRWLRAVAEPRETPLARAAFASALLAASLAEMDELIRNDTVFEERLELLQELHHIWRRHGVLPMLRQTLFRLGLPGRWLAMADGERRLTNFLHLAELLQEASGKLDGEQGLIRWLEEAIADSQEAGEESILRLESEADLVRVVTIHKAKGLEYPIVYVPFAASCRRVEKDDWDIFSEDSAGDPDQARLQEDLRLLYVAVTRARHFLWLGIGTLKGHGKQPCMLKKSAMGYLLGVDQQTKEASLPAILQQVFRDPAWTIRPIAEEEKIPRTLLETREVRPELVNAPYYTGSFERDWGISSFSAMVRDLAELGTDSFPAQTDMEQDFVITEHFHSGRQDVPRHRFPRGSWPGKFLHELLAWLAEEQFGLPGNKNLQEQLRERCRRQGWGTYAEDVRLWLEEVVSTKIPGIGAELRNLRDYLAEMEFWFPVTETTTKTIDALCNQYLLPGVPRPALTPRQLRGLLMGFADLVLVWEGRYWILDYKSNALGENDGAYDQATLERAVCQHRYEVQAILYLLALHRLLQSRLGSAYDPRQHLGGALDWFIRGIAAPTRGACVFPVDPELLYSLDTVLRGEGNL